MAGVGVSFGGAFGFNTVSVSTRAYVDGGNSANVSTGGLSVSANDTAQITAAVGAASVGVGIGAFPPLSEQLGLAGSFDTAAGLFAKLPLSSDTFIYVFLPLLVFEAGIVTDVRRTVEDAFIGLGYEVRDDREVETVEYNFDKLAFLPTHSARSPRDTFFFDDDHVLRTETSPSQIHIMEEKPPPIYMVSIGRVYRRDAITEVPADRWEVAASYDPDPDAPGKMVSKWGGFLAGVDRFDAEFFNCSPREAELMDPQHRVALECAWTALENA